MTNDSCFIDTENIKGEYDELVDAMSKDMYWIRFFARPCCPAPDVEGAIKMLDRLVDEARERKDFTDEQCEHIVSIIESRKAWYPHSGLCRH